MLSDTVEEALINETQPKESKEMDSERECYKVFLNM